MVNLHDPLADTPLSYTPRSLIHAYAAAPGCQQTIFGTCAAIQLPAGTPGVINQPASQVPTSQGGTCTGVDCDCNSWGIFKSLCVAGKSTTKCLGNIPGCAAGSCGPLPIPCWGAVIAGIAIIVLVVVLAKKK